LKNASNLPFYETICEKFTAVYPAIPTANRKNMKNLMLDCKNGIRYSFFYIYLLFSSIDFGEGYIFTEIKTL
jgi:hypothetical protein